MNAAVNQRLAHAPSSRAIIFTAVSAVLALGVAVAVIGDDIKRFRDDTQHAAVLLAQSKGANTEGRALAKTVLKDAPYTPSLLSALALAAEHDKQNGLAASEMTAAGNLSWRDPVSDAWLFDRALQLRDYNMAVQRADALMRTRPDIQKAVIPALAVAATNPAVIPALTKRLAHQPDWRPALLTALNEAADPLVAFSVLSALQTTASPPTEAEASVYVSRLTQLKRYDQALLAMVLFLPPAHMTALKNIFNGDFNDVQGIAPFDWQINPAAGGNLTMEGEPSRPRNRALHVFYDGISNAGLISQVIVLPQGRYHLTGEALAVTPSTSNRLQWTIRCVDGPPILQAPIKAENDWRRFSLDFETPANCDAQILELQPIAGDRRVTVEVWYDSLAIDRADQT